MQLPDLVMPALFAVQLMEAVAGDTAATVTDSLAANSSLPTDANGATLVEANSAQGALGLAITGHVKVVCAGQTLTYSMDPEAVGASAGQHRSLLLDGGIIRLEDMAGSANGSDYDYNDRFWTTSVTEVSGGSSQSYGYPTFVWITAGAGTTETSPTNGWFVVNRNNTAGALTVNFGVVGSTASDTATLDVDYTILGNGTSVTFAAGESQAFVYIHPLIDTVNGPYGPPDEPTEYEIERVTLALSAGTGYSVYTPNEAFIQLGNVDLVFDLDVNAMNGLNDAGIDLAKNYLPGYEGITAKVSTGTSFNVPVYTGQRMKLVLNGVGTASVEVVKRVEFIIAQVSADPGYTGNRTDPTLEGAGNTEDYSFRRNGREGPIILPLAPSKITIGRMGGPSEDHGGPYGGKMEADYTWVNFWCKDYGGAARLLAKIYIADANAPNGERVETRALSVPIDNDINGPNNVGDGIADKWEIAMGARWSAQYGVAQWDDAVALTKFNNFDDIELADPDKDGTTEQGPLRAQAETGDAHTVKEEYRGYILDGGSGFAGGHIRLDPARKEILVEVDRAAVLNNVPGAGDDTNAKLKTILNGASSVFSNATRGAGIYMYWLMDDAALQVGQADVNTNTKITVLLGTSRNTTLKSDFLHLIFIDEASLQVVGTPAGTYTAFSNAQPVRRGSFVATTDMQNHFNAITYPNREQLLGTTVAHELTHQIIEKRNDTFNASEHVLNPNTEDPAGGLLDRDAIMLGTTYKLNAEYGTVKFYPAVQAEIAPRTADALMQ